MSSRLSDKLQASLTTDKEQDDDFKTDRKRLRTPTTEQKVQIQITLNFFLHYLVTESSLLFGPQSSKRRCLERGVIFIDDDDEEEDLERQGAGAQRTMELNSDPRPDRFQSHPQCCVSAPETHFLLVSLIW